MKLKMVVFSSAGITRGQVEGNVYTSPTKPNTATQATVSKTMQVNYANFINLSADGFICH